MTFIFGQSPFQVKGVLYQGTQTYFERETPEGMATLTRVIDEPHVREFISQRFLSSVKYDCLPVPTLIEYEARALDLSLEAYLAGRTAWQADKDINGVYRFLLKLTSAELVASRLPKVLVAMFDFADVDMEKPGPGARIAHFLHIPEPLEEWLRYGIEFYLRRALGLAGAKSIEARWLASTSEPAVAGVEQRTMNLEVTWATRR